MNWSETMNHRDIRWIQRFDSYKKALDNLSEAVALSKKRELSRLEKQGLIQAFEFTYELSWKTLEDFYFSQGEIDIQGSRDAFQIAFQRGLISKGEAFMNSIKSRQMTSHTYNETTAEDIYSDIVNDFNAFLELKERLEKETHKVK